LGSPEFYLKLRAVTTELLMLYIMGRPSVSRVKMMEVRKTSPRITS
jgi:hypothetical protein